jgi:hypothetical protein
MFTSHTLPSARPEANVSPFLYNATLVPTSLLRVVDGNVID